MANEEKKTFRWYDFDEYGDNDTIKQNNSEALRSIYSALFKMMGHVAGKEMPQEDIIKWAQEQGREGENGTLTHVLEKNFNLQELDNKETAKSAQEKLEEMIKTGEINKSEKAILESYLQSYAAYGTGARANIVTSATLLTRNSMNARIGCGQGKTDISKAFAMEKAANGYRTVITSSTPELAAQSFGELLDGLTTSNLQAIYLSNDYIKIPEKDEKGKVISKKIELKNLTEEEIKSYISGANVIISDLTTLVQYKESGLYLPDNKKDVLLQDEQDADLFNNLWNIEIKGKAYDKDTHELRIQARRIASEAVAKLGNLLSGDKISQSVSVNNNAPEFNANGNSIQINGTGINVEIPEGIDELDMQEFLLDAMLAAKVFDRDGKDYVVVDGKVEAISPATGSREDIPEGVKQAISINEVLKKGISEGEKLSDKVQEEYEVEKVVSKLELIREGFSQVSGMSATYGQLGSEVSKEFMETLTQVGVSPDLIPVLEVFKKSGRIPNFENIQEGDPPQEKLTIADVSDKDKKEEVFVTIDGKKVRREVSPHIAAILRDIEAHQGEAIIIATDDREKTIEITEALQKAYGTEREVLGYSGVPQENGDPKLFAPPNPADEKNNKLDIKPPRIIVGDHSIGRGVTPATSDVNEHLIVAQMPSRSEALLEQFLGRVGRKKTDGSVSFVLSSDDGIVQEYCENNGKNPEKATEIITDIYSEKTAHALNATKSDIALSRMNADTKIQTMESIMLRTLYPDKKIEDIDNEKIMEIRQIMESPKKFEEFLKKNPQVQESLTIGLEKFEKVIIELSKRCKGNPDAVVKASVKMPELITELTMEQLQENSKTPNLQSEVENMTSNSRYENITKTLTRAKELSDLYAGKTNSAPMVEDQRV